MRQDQFERLIELQEQMVDVLLVEADSDTWTGGDHPGKLTRDERGDRYWCKRNAAATMALVQKMGNIITTERRRAQDLDPDGLVTDDQDGGPPDGIEELDDQLNKWERAATEAMKRAGIAVK